MLLPVPLLLGLLGLAAAEPVVYFKEQFLDGGNPWPHLEPPRLPPDVATGFLAHICVVTCNYCSEGQHGCPWGLDH